MAIGLLPTTTRPSVRQIIATDPASLCEAAVTTAEDVNRLPPRLLGAISLTETGRIDPTSGRIRPWPWTINAEGEGQFFATRDAAVAAVKALQAKGVQSIDVGCLQVNLMYHPDAFRSLEEAFDPRSNANYAARFLNALHAGGKSWLDGKGFGDARSLDKNDSLSAGRSMPGNDSLSAGRSPPGNDSLSAGRSPPGNDSLSAGRSPTGNDSLSAGRSPPGNDSLSAGRSPPGNDSLSAGRSPPGGKSLLAGKSMAGGKSLSAATSVARAGTRAGGNDWTAREWAFAIAAYHSETPALGEAYRMLVMARWQNADPHALMAASVTYGDFARGKRYGDNAYGAFAPSSQVYGAFAPR
jgi:hypothetical protein